MILYILFKVSFLAVFMACFTQLKYDVPKSIVVIGTSHIIIWLANYTIYIAKGIPFLIDVFPLTVSLPVFICFCFVSRSNGFKVLFSLLTVSIYGMVKTFVAVLLLNFHYNLYVRLTYEILSFALMLALAFIILRKPYFRILQTLDKGWGLLCLVPGLLIAMIYLLQYYPTFIDERPENKPVVLLVFVLSFAFYMILYLNFENVSHYYQLKEDKKIMIVQTDMQKKEYETIIDSINFIKIYRHDMTHHMNVISSFLDDKNILGAQKYIRKLEGKLNESIVQNYCDNYGVNVILSSYINKAKRENIEVVSEVNIPEEDPIDIIELGAIFANAIENAITACKRIESQSDRKISIVCKEHFEQIYIRISNPFVGEVLFDGEYPISENADHGIGTRSIGAIAEKHGGVFSFTAEDGIFNTTVTLMCNADK